VTVAALSPNEAFTPHVEELAKKFTAWNFANQTSTSSVNIGRKYARADEAGVPFIVTIDFDTVNKGLVTIRERDSTQQIQIQVKDAVFVVAQLLTDTITWDEAYNKYPKFFRPDEQQ